MLDRVLCARPPEAQDARSLANHTFREGGAPRSIRSMVCSENDLRAGAPSFAVSTHDATRRRVRHRRLSVVRSAVYQ